jgi:hypothetical protein
MNLPNFRSCNRTLLLLLLGAASPALFAQQTWDDDSGRRMDPPSGSPIDFGSLDTDQDGYLSPNEIPPDHELALQFAALDTDGDGRLSREEADALESVR